MAYDYDKLYRETPGALGAPSPVFTAFFASLAPKGQHVLDAGCGQGRDALFIARLGHRVTGIDLSPHGIQEMLAVAKREALDVTGFAADFTDCALHGSYDVLLFDRTLHMLPALDRQQVLARFLHHAGPSGWVLIADEESNMKGFRETFTQDPGQWRVELEKRGCLFMQRI